MSNACLFSEEELQRSLFHPFECDTGPGAARWLPLSPCCSFPGWLSSRSLVKKVPSDIISSHKMLQCSWCHCRADDMVKKKKKIYIVINWTDITTATWLMIWSFFSHLNFHFIYKKVWHSWHNIFTSWEQYLLTRASTSPALQYLIISVLSHKMPLLHHSASLCQQVGTLVNMYF